MTAIPDMAQFGALFTGNPSPIIICEPAQGHIVGGNPAALRFYRTDLATLTSLTIFEITLLPRARLLRDIDAVLKHGRTLFGYSHRLPGGEIHDVQAYAGSVHVEETRYLYLIMRPVVAGKEPADYTGELEEQLQERTKELHAVYRITELVEEPDVTLERICSRTAALLREASRYPEVTAVQITLHDAVYRTPNLKESPWKQKAPLLVHGEEAGQIEVFYLGDPPANGTEPFLSEEKELLSATAERLGRVAERFHAEAALHAERERLQTIMESSGTGTWEWNIQTGEVVRDREWARMLGLDPGELEPATVDTWRARVHPEDLPRAESALQDHLAGKTETYRCDIRMRHADGSWIWILDSGRVSRRDSSGEPLKMSGTHTNITERKEREERIHRLLEEKDSLLREVHHRVKNDLLLVRSLLSLHREHAGSTHAQTAIEEAEQRIGVMGSIYEQLYSAGNLESVDASSVITTLTENLSRMLPGAGRSIECHVEKLELPRRLAVSVGIIVNELLTNSIKHALQLQENPHACVVLRRRDGRTLSLTVTDNGPGVPQEVVSGSVRGFGLTMVEALAAQHHGTMTISNEERSQFDVILALE